MLDATNARIGIFRSNGTVDVDVSFFVLYVID